jgi:hypothetical protein
MSKKWESALKPVDIGTAVNMLIDHAITMNVHNADKLAADGYPGRQLRIALDEVTAHPDVRFSCGFHLVLRTACLAVGDNPGDHSLTIGGSWDFNDEAYLGRLRKRIRDRKKRAKKRAMVKAGASQPASEQAPTTAEATGKDQAA